MKTAIITGGGSGIGKEIALRMAQDGNHAVILDFDLAGAQAVIEEILAAGGSAEAKHCDVSSMDSVISATEHLSRINILVNNAGIASIGNLEKTSPEELDKIYSVNVKGVYHCLSVVIPKMVAQKQGVVLNMASIASKIGIKDRFAYSMSKGAVHSMTLSVARDYIGHGIRANCICPARVHTPFVDKYLKDHYTEEERPEMFRQLSEFQPIGRMGMPNEIAELANFLCSDKAGFITGSSYDIDGGVTNLR